MTKKWRWRPKCAHFGLPMCLFANWPLKLVPAKAFDDATNERLRSTELLMAAVRLLIVALRVASFWLRPFWFRPFWVASLWLTFGEPFRPVTLRVVTPRRGLESWRLRGVTLRLSAGVLECIRGAERMDGAAERKDGAECPIDRPIEPPPPPMDRPIEIPPPPPPIDRPIDIPPPPPPPARPLCWASALL